MESEFPIPKPVRPSDPHGQQDQQVEGDCSKLQSRQGKKLGRFWRLAAVRSLFKDLRKRGALDDEETKRP